jgi:hypothetical protein
MDAHQMDTACKEDFNNQLDKKTNSMDVSHPYSQATNACPMDS